MGLLVLRKANEEPVIDDSALKAAYVARRFGIFFHFGIAVFTGDEWAEPSTPVNTFNPTALDVQQWVDTAVAAGAKYAIAISKHHDGFCNWLTNTTTYGIGSTTWYASGGVDIVHEFVTRCRAAGIVPGLYFSVWDRRFELEDHRANQAGYRARIEAQLRELLTRYGGIAMIWLDGTEWQFGSAYPWDSAAQRRAFIKSIQPTCLVVNNSHTTDSADSDIIEYEGGTIGAGVPSDNTTPAEACDTMRVDNNWFWKSSGNACLDAPTILSELSTVNSRNATFLLNAGPDNTGNVPSNMVSVLTTVGASL